MVMPFRSGETPLRDRRLVGARVAVVVGPGDGYLVARLAAGEAEREERILRNRGPPLGGEHGLAVVLRGDVLDEPRGNDGAFRILPLPGLHLVAHEDLH